jgi:lipopolysaccharide export LptBFGC system permease protein LptF
MKRLKMIFHWKVLTIIALVTLPVIVLSVDKDALRPIMEMISQMFWAVVIYVLFVKCLYFIFDTLTGYKDDSKK